MKATMPSPSQKNAISNKLELTLSWILGVLIFLHGLLRFESIQNQNYRGSFQYAFDPTLYPNDVFITKSLLYNASILYPLIQFFSIDLTRDLIAIIPYLLLTTLSFYAVFSLLKNEFKIKPLVSILVILLVLVYGEFKPLYTVQSQLFVNSFPTPTWWGHCFALIAISLMARGDIFYATLISTIAIAFIVKTYWIILPTLALTILLNPNIKKRTLLYFIIPVTFVVWKALTTAHLSHSYAELLKMCENVMSRTGFEDSFNLQSKLEFLIYLITFPFYFSFINKYSNTNLKSFLKSVGIVTLLVTLGGYLYTWKLYQYLPIPMLIMISPVRAVFLYGICLQIVLTHWILTNERFLSGQKFFLLTSLIVLRFGIYKNTILAISLFLLSFLYRQLVKLFSKREPLLISKNLTTALTACLLIFTLKPITERWPLNINIDGFKQLHAWTVRKMDPALFEILLEFRRTKEDFTLIVVQDRTAEGYVFDSYENAPQYGGRFISNNYANYIAQKSAYTGDAANFYLDIDLFAFARKRQQLLAQFIQNLIEFEKSNIKERFWDQLAADQVLLLLPNSLTTFIQRQEVIKTYPTFTLVKLK